MMRAAPTEEMRIFLCTQIADEARHVRFFNRFYEEVGVLEAGQPRGSSGGDERAPEPQVQRALRRDAEGPCGPPGPRPRGPRDARRGGHDLPHDHRGDARPHRAALHHRVQRDSRARCPASWTASTRSPATSTGTWPSARASCATWPRRTSATATRSSARSWSAGPAADGVLSPPWYEEGETDLFGGYTLEDTRAFAMKALERRLKVIGLTPAVGLSDVAVRRSGRRAARRRPGRSRITRPRSSGAPSTSTSDMNGPIWRGGKFTTATTRRPSSSSRV